MFFSFVLQVASRYLFNAPVSWTIELCSISYIWVVFWSCDILVSERQQIIFDVIYNMFTPKLRRWVALFITLSLGLTFLAALPGVFDYLAYLGRRTTMLLKIRMDLAYSCFAIFMIAVVVGALRRTRQLLGRNWEQVL